MVFSSQIRHLENEFYTPPTFFEVGFFVAGLKKAELTVNPRIGVLIRPVEMIFVSQIVDFVV